MTVNTPILILDIGGMPATNFPHVFGKRWLQTLKPIMKTRFNS
ncbi:hypothetical protein KP78_02820 [Jeotgalibacillus soli]|uniref:Uncharacterized protein n=1 Tax=Jeotgalibacillus soli TaxID=889306 RepID=A0A0C2VSL2_9BACL|nr:hypothetical protein KP78_02820 [Jeotgalibacillus soli]